MTRGAWAWVAIGGLAIAASALTYAASTRMSATFDEIVLVAGGVRGLETGSWDMITDQPPLMMYAYGGAARSAVRTFPPEDRAWSFDDRWDYARALFYDLDNDMGAVLQRARLVGAALAGLTVAATAAFAWWASGPVAAVVAAVTVAAMPDVLAHGGVAYNDLPLALAFLLAVWALDAWVRRPSTGGAAAAGVAVGASFGMKMSALALLPVGAILLAMEWFGRRGDRAWLRALLRSSAFGALSLYALLVALYRGDATLSLLRFNFWRTVLHTTGGHEAPAYLLGEVSSGGWWYYFPVAALIKTPAPFQALLALAVASLAFGAWRADATAGTMLAWRGRAALVGALVFGGFLMRSDLNAGFRYALPVLPLLALLMSVGSARIWQTRPRAVRAVLVGLLALQCVSTLSAYPHLLAFSSVWAGDRDRAYRMLADSNLDWGQGLIELSDFMDEEGAASVRLSYFGTARPEAYGIEYVALPSFFRLERERTPGAEASPRFTVISATNLIGLYLQGRDPFAPYRDREPYRVLGHALFVFDESTP